MGSLIATKCWAVLDITLHVLLFSSHLGALVWNMSQVDTADKYFPEFGEGLWYTGMASALISIELDAILLIYVAQEYDDGLYWWNFVCLGFGVLSWVAYITLSIYFRSLYLGLWAFGFLYSRATLLLIAKADFVGLFQSKRKEESATDCPSISGRNRPYASTVSVDTPQPSAIKTKSRSDIKSSPLPSTRLFDIEKSATGEDSVDVAGNSLTFCTFLGPQDGMGPDHYIARNESVILANEESVVEELKTKL